MRAVCVWIFLLLNFFHLSFSMTISDWGMTNDVRRLHLVMHDLFRESFQMVADGVYILPDFKHSYEHTSKNVTSNVGFRAYNGRLSNVKIDVSDERGTLRRLPVLKKPDRRHHVLIVCGNCIKIQAEALNYLYEAYYGDRESHGRIYNGPIIYAASFEMNVIYNNENQTNNIPTCKMYFQPFDLVFEMEKYTDPRMENVHQLNFLADKLDTWLVQQLNVTVLNNMKDSLINAINVVSKQHSVCDEFLPG